MQSLLTPKQENLVLRFSNNLSASSTSSACVTCQPIRQQIDFLRQAIAQVKKNEDLASLDNQILSLNQLLQLKEREIQKLENELQEENILYEQSKERIREIGKAASAIQQEFELEFKLHP